MKIICIVGARPNFMKAAPVVEALRRRSGVTVTLLHTGQHYDERMSALFFDELGLPPPDIHLQVGSHAHGEQTGLVLMGLEPVLQRERPDLVMVFGDVNSTLAGALCAAKLGIPVAHVEAGLRSFDRTMPEELNRIVTDHLADHLFATESSGVTNLLAEGIPAEKIHLVGNVMVDTLLKHRERATARVVHRRLGLPAKGYGVLTLHRPNNVDDPETLARLLGAVRKIARSLPIVFPCHPRTRKQLPTAEADDGDLRILEPLGYLDFLSLLCEARLVMTDSGGIQEETTVLGIPCLTLRNNTERPVTIEQGTNMLVGHEPERMVAAAAAVLAQSSCGGRIPDLWDGRAAERIAGLVTAFGARSAAGSQPIESGATCPTYLSGFVQANDAAS